MNQLNWKRWLPTSAPLISGALASAVVLGLRKLGIVVLPQEINDAVTPIFGFLVAAIVHKPTPVADLAHAEEATLGSILAREFQGRLDSNPDLIQQVMNTVLPSLTNPLVVKVPAPDWRAVAESATAAARADQPRSNYGAIVEQLAGAPQVVDPTTIVAAAPIPPAGAVDQGVDLTQTPAVPPVSLDQNGNPIPQS